MLAMHELFTQIERYKMTRDDLTVSPSRTSTALRTSGFFHPALHLLFIAHLDCADRQFSKIGKVMRLVAALVPEAVPRDDEFRFRVRAQAMFSLWLVLMRLMWLHSLSLCWTTKRGRRVHTHSHDQKVCQLYVRSSNCVYRTSLRTSKISHINPWSLRLGGLT